MFRVKEVGLPQDAVEPADLKQLGYFINNVGQIRMIDFPEKDYLFHWYNQERYNEVRREAMQTCQRHEVLKRLSLLGIEQLYLPQLTNTKPTAPHIPILAPPASILRTRKRIIVLINDSLQDLGILAYRRLQRELGLNGGSVIDFTKEIIERSTELEEDFDIFKDGAGIEDRKRDTPGLIVMNCGQLLYSHKYNEAMTLRSWSAMPRKSLCHDMIRIHSVHNHVEGHETPKDHIKNVIDNVVDNKDLVATDAEVYVIALENGGENLLEILNADFEKYAARITALALINVYVDSMQITNPSLTEFLHERARHWKVATGSNDPNDCIDVPSRQPVAELTDDTSSLPPEPSSFNSPDPTDWLEIITSTTTPTASIAAPTTTLSHSTTQTTSPATPTTYETAPLCPTFADALNPTGAGECILTSPLVRSAILSFFSSVANSPSTYKNPHFVITAHEPTYSYDSDGNLKDEDGYGALFPVEESVPEVLELEKARGELEELKAALGNVPVGVEGLEKGRLGLERRIERLEGEVRGLEEKALAAVGVSSGSGSGGGKEVRGRGRGRGSVRDRSVCLRGR